MSRIARKFLRKFTLSQPAVNLYDRLVPVHTLGERGERAASRFLLRQGCVIVDRGYQDKFGEIDLIAVDDETIVFVEVKTRTSDVAGSPAEAVDESKQQRLLKTAKGYLKWHRLTECRIRFDVISITWPSHLDRPAIIHYENAFESAEPYQLF